MRLTALCICGTVLACLSLSWSTADSDEGDLLGDHGFGPCIATLRPEWPCRQGQDESTCPYLFSLPPLTLQLPKQLGELEKIVMDLQKLKDNVDQLRRMCADCTVSQTERECEKQKEIEHENLNEDTDRHKDETNCLNERTERPKDFGKEGGTDRVKSEKTMTGNGDSDSKKRMTLEERGRKKWEAERETNKGVVKESEKSKNVKEMAEKDGKTMTEVAKGNDKSGQAKVPISGGNERTVDVRKMPVEKNKQGKITGIQRQTEIKTMMEKGDSNGDPEGTMENGKDTSNWKNKEKTEESDHHMWQGETKETEKKTQTEEERGRDEIKMSEGHDEHTNKEREQQGTEREKEMEKGIKVERNNEKSKQAESIGRAEKERTIKEGEDRETGTDIKTDGEKTVQSVQRDSDGELVSSKATERTDFVSISSTPHSIISLAPRHESMDSTKAITFTSSLPSPSLSSSTSHWITDVSQQTIIVADTLPTQSTYLGPAGISELPSSDVEENFRTTAKTTINTLEGPGHQITSPTSRFTSTTSVKPEAGFPGHVSSTTTTTTPHQDFYTTMFPGVADRSRWTEKKNITTNKTGVRQLPGRGPKPGEKHKPAIKPEADQKLKNPKNDRKHDQKQQPPHQKPTTNQKSKPGKHSKVQIPKQIPTQPDDLTTDQSLKINQIPKQDQEHTTDQLRIENQESNPKATLPAQRQTVNTTVSDEDLRTGRKPESVEIPATTQISKPENNLVHPFKTNKPDQPQKTHKKLKSDEETKPDQRLTLNPYLPVQQPKPESETINLMPRPSQKSKIELMENSDENPSPKPKYVKDSTPGQTLIPDRALTKLPDQKSKLSQKIPKINQKPKPHQKHPVVVTGRKIKPKVKPKPDQTPQTNTGTPLPDQIFNLNPETLPDEITEAITNKPSKPWAPPRRRPIIRPGATPVQRPKPAVQQQPSPKTQTDLEPLQISGTTSDDIQHSQSDVAPAPGPVTQIAEVSHFPGDTKFRPSTTKSITLGPKTSNSLESGPVPRPHTLSEGFTVSPNSRITSDLRPQTAGQPPSIPMTTRPNKIIRGILPSVIPSISPGSTKPSQASNTDSSLQAEILLNVEETELRQTPDPDTMMIPVLNLSAQTASTVNSDLRSTTPDTSGLEPPAVEASTPSARELRVKINQVAAFFNNSLSPNAGPLDRHPKEHTEDNQGDSRPHRPDSKLPLQIPSKVSMARDCADHLLRGKTKSAVYLVTPDLRSRSFPVLCDMELDGGGWTLLQQRLDGSVSFNRTWADYRSGFGELDGGEFWLGNNMIHLLTRDRDVVLRVELEDFDGVMEYAEYEQFRVASERMRYRLTVGGYSGTAGDALRFSKSYDHNNRAFTTPDRDHDRYPSGNCGAYYSSGWWFDACMAANLNGRYYAGRYKGVRDGIFWGTWQNISTEYYPTNDRQSFKTVRMMIRPKGFAP